MQPMPTSSETSQTSHTSQMRLQSQHPKAIVYGPSEYSGIEMRSHQTEQGISQINSLMMSLRAEGVPHKLALITLAWAQLLAGTQKPVLSDVMIALPHIAPMKWIPSIHEFLHSIGGRMEVENLPVTPLQREHDQFLMDIALDLYSKPSDLQHLNACRLYLQVTLLSDITTADGKFIRSEVVEFWGLPPIIPLLQYVNRLGFEICSVKQNKEAWLC